MKKYFSIATLSLFGIIGLASCSKDYTCECTTSVNGGPTSTSTHTVTGKKKDAREECESGSGSNGFGSINCEIK